MVERRKAEFSGDVFNNKCLYGDSLPPDHGLFNSDKLLAVLNAPYDPVQIVKDLLEHAVYDENRSDECADAVQNARGYLEQEGVE